MAKKNVPTNTVIKTAIGTLIETENIRRYKRVQEKMTLCKLMEKKVETESRIKSLIGTLLGHKNYTLDFIKSTNSKIEALQYNMTVFKQLNAIHNAGNPDAGMFGINASIYQAGDAKVLANVLQKVDIRMATTFKEHNEYKTIRSYLDSQRVKYKGIKDNLYKMQSAFNNKMKVIVEYLIVE